MADGSQTNIKLACSSPLALQRNNRVIYVQLFPNFEFQVYIFKMDTPEKKKRKRQKKLCKQIREQMEFYFSDSNLHKDRFLRKQIDQSEDGWLDLEMFSKFNKLKTLTTDMSLVVKALSTSELLKVSEDDKKVKRVIPISEPKDVDERTVYVEHLPVDADHDWVKNVFSPYGKVAYVSLPRYRSTGDIKGFAFVEFFTQEDALRACQEMNNPPVSASDKIGKFPVKGSKQFQKLQKQLSAQKGISKRGHRTRTVSETEVMDRKADDMRDALQKSDRKRIRTWSQGSGSHQNGSQPLKKPRLGESDRKNNSSSEESSEESEDEKQESEIPVKGSKSSSQGGSDVKLGDKMAIKRSLESTVEGDRVAENQGADVMDGKKKKVEKTESEVKSKKKKNRKRKKKIKEEEKEIPELRVIPKKEWLELRNEYLTLQKYSMKKLKEALKERHTNEDEVGAGDMEVSEAGAEKENDSQKAGQQGKKSRQPEYTPGVIVKVNSVVPLHRKQLKEKVTKFGEVAYIDVLDGDTKAHIRCPNAEQAAKISAASVDNYTITVLTGEEESKYWEKLVSDREKKLNTKSRPKKRGKDKAIGKASHITEESNKNSKHIVFDDDT